jgi:hypothetical protein
MNETTNKYYCEKCDYKCKYLSQWTKHINREVHKTGIRKTRSDIKPEYKCDKCTYKTKNVVMYKQHKLNEHSTIEEREKCFNLYCKTCNFGTFSKDLFNTHIKSKKHTKYVKNPEIIV